MVAQLERPAAPTMVYHTAEDIRALIASEAADIPLMSGRPTDDQREHFQKYGLTSIIPRKGDKSWKVKADKDVLRTIRVVMDRDPDVSKAAENFILLVGDGYQKTAYKRSNNPNANPQEDPRAQSYLDDFDRRIGIEYGGGMDSIIPVLVKTLLHYGAVAVELELSEDLSEVVDVHPVRPDRITFKRDKQTGRLRSGIMTPRHGNVEGADEDGFLELPGRQFRYIPFHPHVDEPYGYPPFLSALAAVFFKVELLEDAKMAIHVNGHGRLDVTIDLEKLQAGMPQALTAIGQEDKARAWVKARIAEVSAAFKTIQADQSLFHGSDVSTEPIGPQALPDLRGIMTVIDNQVISGTKQLPILLGRNEGATTTHATVQWGLFAKQVHAFSRIIKRIIEWVHGEALAVAGFASYSRVDFDEVRASDELAEQNVIEKKIANWDAMVSLGWADDEEGAMDTLNHRPVGERKPAPVPVVTPAPDSGSTAEDNTQQEDTTDGNQNLVKQPRPEQPGKRIAPVHPGVNPGKSQLAGQRSRNGEDDGSVRHSDPDHGSRGHGPDLRQPAERPDHGNHNPGGEGGRLDPIPFEQIREGADQLGPLRSQRRRKKMIPEWNVTRLLETSSSDLDNLTETILPDVQARFTDLAEKYAAAKAAADQDSGQWFETEAGRDWRSAFVSLLVDHYKQVWNVRGAGILADLGIEGSFDLANPDAIKVLEELGLSRVTGMTDTTIDLLRTVLADGIDKGLHPSDIARLLRERIADMSKERAETIARTETAFAYSYAALETYKRNGVERKIWLTAEDDKVDPPCNDYEARGSIPIDEAFGGDDQHPPAHPRCRCALIADVESVGDDPPVWKGE